MLASHRYKLNIQSGVTVKLQFLNIKRTFSAIIIEWFKALRFPQNATTYQWTKTLPFFPSFPSFSPFSIQLPVFSNSSSKFSSSISSTPIFRCSYLSQSSKSLKSYFKTDTICVMPALTSADLRRRVNILDVVSSQPNSFQGVYQMKLKVNQHFQRSQPEWNIKITEIKFV